MRSLSLLLLLFAVAPAFAQETLHRQKGQSAQAPPPVSAAAAPAPAARSAGGDPILHVTDFINARPEFQASLEAFARRREETPHLLYGAAGKTSETYDIGDTRVFKVYNYEKSGTDVVMDNIEFTLKAETPRFMLWVETAELSSGQVQDSDVESLRTAMMDRTPDGSVNPSAGIIVNNETLFGTPPDVDGNGKTDILLVDVRDGWTPGNGYIGGFVWHSDVIAANPTDANHQYSNGRDILYLDTKPALNGSSTVGLEGTAAHEYQHLIHLAYDTREETFVNEGLSEWAEIANGYYNRDITYLGKVSEHNTPLFAWRNNDPEDPNLVLNDYERAGLFTTYIAERIGTAATGRIVQAANAQGFTLRGTTGYGAAITAADPSLTLAQLVADFHVANFLNDAATAPFGYTLGARQGFPIVSSRTYDGTAAQSSNVSTLEVNDGAVQYFTWENVAHLNVTTDVIASTLLRDSQKKTMRERIRIVAIAEPLGEPRRIETYQLGPNALSFTGNYERITLAFIDTRPAYGLDRAQIDIRGTWEPFGEGNVSTQEIAYDNGNAVADKYFRLNADAANAAATRFTVPTGGETRLAKIEIAPFYLSQFSNGEQPTTAPRDVTIKVWTANTDGTPGEELLSVVKTDPRAYKGVSGTALDFFEVNLADYADQLSALPETIFVGYAEAGTDANYLVGGVASYPAENVSYVWNAPTGAWKRLWDVQFGSSAENEYPVQGTAIPVRAHFVVTKTVANEAPAEVPVAVTLDQNYPNPFNPTTAIRFSLPQAGAVRLAVYDVLGRHVTTLVDGMEPAGAHEVRLDAADWASGLYVYVLETAQQTLTKKMLLVK